MRLLSHSHAREDDSYLREVAGLLTVLIARRQKTQRTVRLISTGTALYDGTATNLSLSATGIMAVATEWWSFEIPAIMVARLSPSEIGAQSVNNRTLERSRA